MNAPIVSWVLQHYQSDKRTGACQRKFVLYLIASTANSQGWAVQETVRAIAHAADLSDRQAQRYIRELQREGVLLVLKQANGAAANLYRVLVPIIDQRASKPPEVPPLARVRKPATPANGTNEYACIHSLEACAECVTKGAHVSRTTVTV